MIHERTYLDYNATAPMQPRVRAAIAEALGITGNPSSVHTEGRRVRAAVETARDRVAGLVGADPRNVIFTSGGSEANVTALAPEHAGGGNREAILFVSAIEHPSVLSGGRFGPGAVRHLPVTAQGVVDVAACEAAIAEARTADPDQPILVSVMVANNETGAVQPIAEIARIARTHGAVVHADAVQAAGKVAFDIESLDADMMSLSAHKLGGPQGVGALVLASGFALKRPLITGGGQELRRRAGTENVAGIVGFGVAAELAVADLSRLGRIAALRDRLEAELTGAGTVVFAQVAERLPNTSLFAVAGVKAETAVIGLDLEGVAVSSGSACSSGKVERSHVLEAMGVAPELADGAIRVSLGWDTTREDIERFLAAWSKVCGRAVRHRSAA